jgi:hypothetical protein
MLLPSCSEKIMTTFEHHFSPTDKFGSCISDFRRSGFNLSYTPVLGNLDSTCYSWHILQFPPVKIMWVSNKSPPELASHEKGKKSGATMQSISPKDQQSWWQKLSPKIFRFSFFSIKLGWNELPRNSQLLVAAKMKTELSFQNASVTN